MPYYENPENAGDALTYYEPTCSSTQVENHGHDFQCQSRLGARLGRARAPKQKKQMTDGLSFFGTVGPERSLQAEN